MSKFDMKTRAPFHKGLRLINNSKLRLIASSIQFTKCVQLAINRIRSLYETGPWNDFSEFWCVNSEHARLNDHIETNYRSFFLHI